MMTSLISSPIFAQWIASDSTVIGSGSGPSALDFPAEDAAYITGDMGLLYKSVDEGVSWGIHNNFGPFSGLNSPIFISADTGFVSVNGAIQRTFDGGLSWTPITTNWWLETGLPLYKIEIADDVIVGSYTIGDTVYLVKSIDFGDSFTTLYEHIVPSAKPFLYSFIDSLTAFVINPLELEQVYKTNDGFNSLDTINISTGPIDLELYLHYTEDQNGYLFGDWGSESNPSRSWRNLQYVYFPILLLMK